MDSFDGNKKLDKNEFFTGLKEWGITVTKAEADVLWILSLKQSFKELMKIIDKDKDGTVNFDEFLQAIRVENEVCEFKYFERAQWIPKGKKL